MVRPLKFRDWRNLDNFLIRRCKGVPKSHIYRILRSGEVRVNGTLYNKLGTINLSNTGTLTLASGAWLYRRLERWAETFASLVSSGARVWQG